MIEKDLIDGKITLLELMEKDPKAYAEIHKRYFNDGYNAFDKDYFSTANNYKTYFDLRNKSFSDVWNDILAHPPQAGIITQDGIIYTVGSFHATTSLWLKLNGVDLRNSIRYAIYDSGSRVSLEFYEGYDSGDFYPAKAETINDLCQIWNETHESDKTDNHVIELTKESLKTMLIICQFKDKDISKVLAKNNVFGFLAKPYAYSDPNQAERAKINRCVYKHVTRIDIDKYLAALTYEL